MRNRFYAGKFGFAALLTALALASPLVSIGGVEAPVADAAMAGDIETVRALLRDGADVNGAGGDGMTALHWAAQNNDAETMQVLLYAGAAVEPTTRMGGYTPLHLAGKAGAADTVAALLAAGSDGDRTTTTGLAPLHFAAQSGSAPTVSALIAAGVNLDTRDSGAERTPLMYAAAFNRLDVMRALLDAGADPALETTVVDWAERKREDDAEMQIYRRVLAAAREPQPDENAAGGRRGQLGQQAQQGQQGQEPPDPNAPPQPGQQGQGPPDPDDPPQQGQQGQGPPDPDDPPQQGQQGETPPDPDDPPEQGQQGETPPDPDDPPQQGQQGETPPDPDDPPQQGQQGETPPDPDDPPQQGQTPPDPDDPPAASGQTPPDPAEPTDPADPDAEPTPPLDPNVPRSMSDAEQIGKQGGFTALHYAARDGRFDAAIMLLDSGMDIDHRTGGDESTAMVVAAVNGNFDLALTLLERGADPNAVSEDGVGALFAAINNEWQLRTWYPQPTASQQQQTTYLDLMRALLEAGADPNQRVNHHIWYAAYNAGRMGVDFTGATAFWRAAYGLDVAAMKLLVEYGADPNMSTFKLAGGRRRFGFADLEGREDKSGLEPVPPGGPHVHPLHAATGVGFGTSRVGQQHRHIPDGWLPTVQYLVGELGVDVNVRDADGYSGIHNAASRGDNETIEYLVEHGADVTFVSRRGQTTVDMANGPQQRVQPFPETIALLEGLGAENNNNCISCD